MDNFNLRKYLTENKLTSNSKLDEIGDASAEPYKWTREVSNDGGEVEKVSYKFTTDLDTPYVAFFDMLAPMEYEFWYAIYGKLLRYTSNKGELFRVMATMVAIMKDFMDLMDNNWSEISFEGEKDPSVDNDTRRDKLYMAYIKKHLPSNITVSVDEEGKTVLKNTLAENE